MPWQNSADTTQEKSNSAVKARAWHAGFPGGPAQTRCIPPSQACSPNQIVINNHPPHGWAVTALGTKLVPKRVTKMHVMGLLLLVFCCNDIGDFFGMQDCQPKPAVVGVTA